MIGARDEIPRWDAEEIFEIVRFVLWVQERVVGRFGIRENGLRIWIQTQACALRRTEKRLPRVGRLLPPRLQIPQPLLSGYLVCGIALALTETSLELFNSRDPASAQPLAI